MALVSVAYAAAPSWLSAIAYPGAHRRAAEALLRAVHARLLAIPEARRPRLVVHGESLGANAIAQALERDPELAREVEAGLLVGGMGSARWGEGRDGQALRGRGHGGPALRGRVRVARHPDDPVANLSRVPRVRELLALRCAASAPLGTGHRYGPELEHAWLTALGSRLAVGPRTAVGGATFAKAQAA